MKWRIFRHPVDFPCADRERVMLRTRRRWKLGQHFPLTVEDAHIAGRTHDYLCCFNRSTRGKDVGHLDLLTGLKLRCGIDSPQEIGADMKILSESFLRVLVTEGLQLRLLCQ